MRGRYGNVRRTRLDGWTFASAREAARYQELKLLRVAGQITELEVHPSIPIVFEGRPVLLRSERYPNGRVLRYVADFRYAEDGKVIVEDVKMQSGHRTETYRLKRALVAHMGIEIRET